VGVRPKVPEYRRPLCTFSISLKLVASRFGVGPLFDNGRGSDRGYSHHGGRSALAGLPTGMERTKNLSEA